MPTIISNLISVSEMLKVSEQRILITPNMGKSGEKCQKSVVKSTFNFGGTFGQSGLMTFRLSEETDGHKEKHFLYISMGLFGFFTVYKMRHNVDRNRKHNCAVIFCRNVAQSLKISQLKQTNFSYSEKLHLHNKPKK